MLVTEDTSQLPMGWSKEESSVEHALHIGNAVHIPVANVLIEQSGIVEQVDHSWNVRYIPGTDVLVEGGVVLEEVVQVNVHKAQADLGQIVSIVSFLNEHRSVHDRIECVALIQGEGVSHTVQVTYHTSAVVHISGLWVVDRIYSVGTRGIRTCGHNAYLYVSKRGSNARPYTRYLSPFLCLQY